MPSSSPEHLDPQLVVLTQFEEEENVSRKDLMMRILSQQRVSLPDDGPYTKHTGGSRTPDGALAIRRQSIPGEPPVRCCYCSSG